MEPGPSLTDGRSSAGPVPVVVAREDRLCCRNVCAPYDEVIERTAARYGASSQAVALVKLRYLVALLESIDRTQCACERVTLGGVVADLAKWYESTVPPLVPAPVRILDSERPLLEYDDAAYERYRQTGSEIQQDIQVVGVSILEEVEAASWYNYAIDERDRLVIHRRALSLKELALARRMTGSSMVTHPMLVHDTLRVQSAGEILFVGTREVRAVVANTKSGHFCPPPQSALVLRRCCEHLFRLEPERIVVFAVGFA